MSGNEATSWRMTSQERKTHQVQLQNLTKSTPGTKQPQMTPVEAEMLAEVNEVYHKLAGTLHITVTGHPDTDHKISEPYSEEAEETIDCLHPSTAIPGTRTPQ